MRSGRKVVEEMAHILVQHRIHVQEFGEFLAFILGRQFPVNEQVRDLDEHGFLDQILDRNAAIAQNAFFPVDIRDLAVAGRCVHKTRVECDITGFPAQIRDVDRLFALGADHDRQPHHFVFDLKRHKFGTLVHVGILLLNNRLPLQTSRGNAPSLPPVFSFM